MKYLLNDNNIKVIQLIISSIQIIVEKFEKLSIKEEKVLFSENLKLFVSWIISKLGENNSIIRDKCVFFLSTTLLQNHIISLSEIILMLLEPNNFQKNNIKFREQVIICLDILIQNEQNNIEIMNLSLIEIQKIINFIIPLLNDTSAIIREKSIHILILLYR